MISPFGPAVGRGFRGEEAPTAGTLLPGVWVEAPATPYPRAGKLVTSVRIWQRMGQKLLSNKEAWREERRSSMW